MSNRPAVPLPAEGPGPDWIRPDPEGARRDAARGRRETRTLSDLLRAQVRQRPKHPAVVAETETLTYAELDARAERLALRWRAEGVRRGERVLLCVGNRPEHVVALYAAVRLGAVPVLALPALGDEELRAVAEAAGASLAVLAERDGRRDLRPAAAAIAGLPGVRSVLTSRELRAASLGRPAEGEEVAVRSGQDEAARSGQEGAGAPGIEDAHPEDLALLTLSGGTTGAPKLIPRTHADYGYNALASARACGVGPEAVYLAVLPAAHNFTMVSPGIVGVISVGGTLVLCPDPSPTTAFALIERAGVTITSLVPALVAPWLDEARRTRADLGSLRVLQVGGARLDAGTARRVEPELGCALQQVFGMAEGLNCYTALGAPAEIVQRTQGRPLCPGDEVLVVDERDRPVPDGEPGELLTRGPYTIRGYYRARELDAVRFTPEGFYRTGDVVVRSPGGDLTVVDRVKDQVNRAGEKIAAPEVEEHLLAHPGVRAAAVVAAPDPDLGERSVAFLVATASAAVPDREDLRVFLRGRGAASFKVPDDVRTLPSLPLTGVGKVDKRRLRELLVEDA